MDSHPNIIRNQPTAIKTIFGWIIMRQISSTNVPCRVTSLLTVTEPIDATLKKFWETEEIYVEAHFNNTHYRDAKGKYVVSMPIRENGTPLNTNRKSAFKCYMNLEKRLTKTRSL